MRRHHRYSKAEEQQILKRRAAGESYESIARDLGLSAKSINDKYISLTGRKKPRETTARPRLGTKPRLCMCCGDRFHSEGPHHRLCTYCRLKSLGPLDTPVSLR